MAITRLHLTIAEILAMTEEDFRIECLRLEIPVSGLDKSTMQRQLLGHIVARTTSTPASQTRTPPAYAAVNIDPVGPDQEGFFIIEDSDLEDSGHGEEDLEEQDHDFQETLHTHLPPRQ